MILDMIFQSINLRLHMSYNSCKKNLRRFDQLRCVIRNLLHITCYMLQLHNLKNMECCPTRSSLDMHNHWVSFQHHYNSRPKQSKSTKSVEFHSQSSSPHSRIVELWFLPQQVSEIYLPSYMHHTIPPTLYSISFSVILRNCCAI